MSDTNTGGPAFPSGLIDPSTPEDAVQSLHNSMTLRDYFAAKALKTFSDDTDELIMENATKAYKQADAMLRAREAK